MLTRLGENDSAFVTTVGVHWHGLVLHAVNEVVFFSFYCYIPRLLKFTMNIY